MSSNYPSMPSGKLPFATYDLVVYLGGAAFLVVISALFISSNIPIMRNPDSFNEYVYSIFVVIGVLFLLYVVGHTTAYLSAVFVEGLAMSTVGYPSQVYEQTSGLQGDERRQKIKKMFFQNLASAFRLRRWVANIARFVFCAPILVTAIFAELVRISGFSVSKLPPELLVKVKERLSQVGWADVADKPAGSWFKVVEHYVNCNFDSSSRRMYNYLLIYGTLRTATFVLLIAFWLEINQLLVTRAGFTLVNMPSYLILRDRPGTFGGLITFTILAAVCYFCYIKFNRRYFEEAMLAFTLVDRNTVGVSEDG